MKKFLYTITLITILLLTITYKNKIIKFILIKFIDNDLKFEEKNAYYKDYDYGFVQNTTNLYATTKQDVLNIIYTTLNRGMEKIIFYCDYEGCQEDVNNLAKNKKTISSINNLVHPFNSYSNIYFTITSYDKITIKVKKQYSDSETLLINNKLNQITSSLFNENTSEYNKIKLFHDYIIDNTTYDESVTSENQSDTNSNKAIGLLFEGKAICSGYSDTMAIFLNKYNINNYKISSDDHIWNLVYINNEWKNIDTTWDDPITSDGKNVILDDFFLISTNELIQKEKKLEKNSHNYDTNIYIEANQ